jgi:hypothetical protein
MSKYGDDFWDVVATCYKVGMTNRPVTELVLLLVGAGKIEKRILDFKALEQARKGAETTAIGPLTFDSSGKVDLEKAKNVQRQLELLDVAISEAREQEKNKE